MTTTTKKAPKAKKLLLTSRAKAPKKAQPERAAEIAQELIDAGTNPQAAPVLGEIMAQVPAHLSLDGDAVIDTPSLAELVKPAKAMVKAPETEHAGMANETYRHDPEERGEDGLLTERACFSRAETWARRTGKDAKWGVPEAGGCDEDGFSCTFTDMTVVEVDRRTGKCRRAGHAEVEPRPAKEEPKAEQTAPSVVLTREPGRGWFHIAIDGERVGVVFQTTQKGAKLWAAETPDRALRTEGANRTAAIAAFVAAVRRG